MQTLKLSKIGKKYADKWVVRNADFEVTKGRICGLLGPNGAGKTTTLRMIAGFLTLSSGEIIWKGKRVEPKDFRFRQSLGYLPESNPVYENLSVLEQLHFLAKVKIDDLQKREREVGRVIKACGLKEVEGQKIETLSKGYRQRLGLAGAFLGDPPILLLDEPTSGLDPNQVLEIRSVIKKMAKDKWVIFSSHILSEVQALCQDLALIDKGKIVKTGKIGRGGVKALEKMFVSFTGGK